MTRPPTHSAAAYSAGSSTKVTDTAALRACTGVYSMRMGSQVVCQGGRGERAVGGARGKRGLTASATVATMSFPLKVQMEAPRSYTRTDTTRLSCCESSSGDIFMLSNKRTELQAHQPVHIHVHG